MPNYFVSESREEHWEEKLRQRVPVAGVHGSVPSKRQLKTITGKYAQAVREQRLTANTPDSELVGIVPWSVWMWLFTGIGRELLIWGISQLHRIFREESPSAGSRT